MIDIQSVQIQGTNLSSDVITTLTTIFTTPKGTVPFDRNFGIDISILDEPVNLAKGRLTVEFIREVQQYEPRASVKEVTFTLDENNNLIPKVRVE